MSPQLIGGKMLYMQGESGLWYEWNGAHTVNVQEEAGGQDLDVFSIGSFADNAATVEEFEESVREHESMMLSES